MGFLFFIFFMQKGNSGITIESGGSSFIFFLLALFIVIIFSGVMAANWVRNSVRQVNGEHITVGDFFSLKGIGTIILASLAYSFIIVIGFILFIIPGFIAAVMLMYVPIAAALPNATVGNSFFKGYRIFKENAGVSVLVILLIFFFNLIDDFTLLSMVITKPLSILLITVAFLMGLRRSEYRQQQMGALHYTSSEQ